MNTNLPFHDLISTHVPTSLLCYYFTALVCIHDRHDNLHAIINVFDSVNLTLIVSVSTLIWCLTSRWTTEQEIFNIQDHWPRGTHDVTERHYGPERLRDAGETYVDGLAWKWRFCLGTILTIITYHREHYTTTICCTSLAAYLALSLSHTGSDMS